jgi:hypothetical protein
VKAGKVQGQRQTGRRATGTHTFLSLRLQSSFTMAAVSPPEVRESKENSGRDIICRFNSPFIVKLDNRHGIDQSVLAVALAHPAACAVGTE